MRKEEKRSVDTGSYDSISGYVFYSFIFNIYRKYVLHKITGGFNCQQRCDSGCCLCGGSNVGRSQESGSVPRSINNVQPYHSLLGNDVGKIQNKMNEELNGLGTGFLPEWEYKTIPFPFDLKITYFILQ